MPVSKDPRAQDLALRESNYWKEFDEENVLFEPLAMVA
jgi:hypothetical protein